MKVLVTGVNGFVGAAIARRLWTDRRVVAIVGAVRNFSSPSFEGLERRIVKEIDGRTDWSDAFADSEIVIHLAARVHIMQEVGTDPLAEFRRVNVEGTLHLAWQAAAAGVRRFVFVSSIKVNGEATLPGRPFTADDLPAPIDPYGISKWEAEEGLRRIAAETGMEVVIIRPPLVYGPGVKANFAAMMRWLRSGVPLPLGGIDNRRSLVALDNLVDLIVTCMVHPVAANQTFLVSYGEDVSTSELLRRMGRAMGRPACLLPVPVRGLELAAALLGKRDVAQRLCGSLQADIEKTRRLLGWQPPLTLDEGLKKAAKGAVW